MSLLFAYAPGGKDPYPVAELSDVVAWLEEHHGARRVQARKMSLVYDEPDWWLDEVRVDDKGTYLVVRVSDD